jgi:hypothetical protein
LIDIAGGATGRLVPLRVAVAQSAAEGPLTSEEGKIINSILEVRRKTVETEELNQRVNVLEKIAGQRQKY